MMNAISDCSIDDDNFKLDKGQLTIDGSAVGVNWYGPVSTILQPHPVAAITVCGCMTINVDSTMSWIPPTPEQIKNLHDTLCIDVKIL